MSKTVIIAYVPVLHEGYRRLFTKHSEADTLYIFGESIIAEFDHLRKEIRALCPNLMLSAIKGLNIFSQVKLLDAETIGELQNNRDTIFVMPKEDVTQDVATRYFPNCKIVWENIFLRWDIDYSLSEKDIANSYLVSDDLFNIGMMNQALELSQNSSDWWRRVGGIIVKKKEIVLCAWNSHLPSPHSPYSEGDPRNNFKKGIHIELSTSEHAESILIGEAARRGIALDGCSLYITTFPCPPCAKLVARAGIKKLFYREGYAMLDGERILKQKGVEIFFVTKTPAA